MALKDGQELGGVYVPVGLDFDKLDTDLSRLQTRLDAAARGARVNASVNLSGSGGGGGAGFGGLLAVGSVVLGEMRKLSQQVGRGMDAVSRQLAGAAGSLKVVADATKATQRAAHDLYREEARQYHAAQATRLFARTAGIQMGVNRREGFAGLPADIRYIAGAGFDQQTRASRIPAAAIAPEAAKAVAKVVENVARAAENVAMSSPGRATIPFRDPAADARGPLNAPNRYRRAGKADLSVIGDFARLGAGTAGLTMQAAGADIKAVLGGLRRLETGLAAVGHSGVLAFTLISGAVRGVELRMQRFAGMMRPIGSLMAGSFRLAMLPVRGLMGLLGGGGGGGGGASSGGGVLALPFRAASAAADSLATSVGRTASLLKLGAIGAAVGLFAKGFWDAAKANETTQGLLSRIGQNVSSGAQGIGEALQPAFQEVLALVIDLSEATKGITPLFVRVAQVVGGAIQGTVHFLRQMVANWQATGEFIKLTFMQFGENARYMVGYIVEVFSKFLDWFSTNWRTIFLDAFTVVVDGIRNLAQNIWDFIKAIWDWLKDPVNNTFTFTATPIIDRSKLKTEALELPDFKLPETFLQQMTDAAARILGTKVADPKELAIGGADKKGSSRVGDLIGARELHDMLQRGTDNKKDSKNHEATAKNTRETVGKLGEIAKQLGKGVVGVAGF